MIQLPSLGFYAPSEHDISCTYEVNQMPMLFLLLLPRASRAVSVKIIYTNCFQLMEIQSLQTVFFISGAWILKEIVKYNWYHMLFIVFHMKESRFPVDHRILLGHCAKSSNTKVTCDEGTMFKAGIACIISWNWRFILVCLSIPRKEIFWHFLQSTKHLLVNYGHKPKKMCKYSSPNNRCSYFEHYPFKKYMTVESSLCFRHFRNVNNHQIWN